MAYKRIVDGPGVWRSDKIRRAEPIWIRAEFANLLPLALANGVFECDPGRVYADVYSFNRPDITPDKVPIILDGFVNVKLLFRWQADGKTWGFWVGIDKGGRLPPASRLRQGHEPTGPTPPPEALAAFLANGHLPAPQPTAAPSEAGEFERRQEPDRSGEIFSIWNSECGSLPRAKKLTNQRRKKIHARFSADPSFADNFRSAVQKCVASPFLRGEGRQGWKANLDWLIENETNIVRVLEGAYDGDPQGVNHGNGIGNRKASGAVAGAPGKYAGLRPTLVAAN